MSHLTREVHSLNNFDSIRQFEQNRSQKQVLVDRIDALEKENLELKTRLQCNEFNFHKLLEATWLLAKLSEIDGVRYGQAIEKALSPYVAPETRVQVRDATYLSIAEIRVVLKSTSEKLTHRIVG